MRAKLMAGPWDKYQAAPTAEGPWAKYGETPRAPTPAADPHPLSSNPIAAAVSGFNEAKDQIGRDWQDYTTAFKTPAGKQPAKAGATPADLAADRFGGDLIGLVGNPLKEALASVLKGPAAAMGGKSGDEARSLAEGAGASAGLFVPIKAGRSALPETAVGAAKVADAPVMAAKVRATPNEIKVGTALHKALDRGGVKPDEVIATLQAHPNRPAYHAGGNNVLGYAKALQRTPGPGRDIVEQAARAHQRAAQEQIKADIGSALGGKGDYLATLDKALEQRRQAARQGMDAMGALPVTLDENAVTALRSVRAKAAIDDTASNLLSSIDPEERNTGAFLRRLHDQLLDQPHPIQLQVRQAQDISKSLLDAADSAYKNGDGSRGKVLKALGRAVRDNAADPEKGGVSAYGDWLRQYGQDSENKEALELGRNAVKSGIDNTSEAIAKRLKGMKSEASKDFYRKGLGEALLHQVRTKGGVAAMRDLIKSEEFQDKVHLAYPDRKSYDAFIEAAEERVAEQERNNRVLKGSDSAENAAAMLDLNAQGVNPATMLKQGAQLIHSPAKTLAGAVEKGIDAHLKKSGILADPETNRLLAKALSDPKEMERILRLTDPASLKSEPVFNWPPARGNTILDQALKP